MGKIRVLVADDSYFMRKVISDMIVSDPALSVIGTAANGMEAVKEAKGLRPDVITMDVQMPLMDGFEALKQIMAFHPMPIIMLSAFTKDGAALTLDCLHAGAVDVVEKPGGTVSLNMDDVKAELLRKIKVAANAKVKKTEYVPSIKKIRKPSGLPAKKVIGIVSSTGGPSTVAKLLPLIPSDINAAIVLVQHMPGLFIGSFVNRLDSVSALGVKEAKNGEPLLCGQVYVAPGGTHLEITKLGKISLVDSAPIMGLRPFGSKMLSTGAAAFGRGMVAVVLTGMGNDGLEGAKAVKKSGGTVLAQDEETSIVFGMPKEVIDAGCADKVLSPDKIAEELIRLAGRL